MKFFFDANIPLSLINSIKLLGHEVAHAREIGLASAPDKEIAEYAKKQKAILLTKDLEFGNLIIYPKNSHYGLFIIRLPYSFTASQFSQIIKDFLTKINPEILMNSITILELGKYRIRKL